MKKILLAVIITLAAASVPVFAADNAAPAANKTSAPKQESAETALPETAAKAHMCSPGEKTIKGSGKMCPEHMKGVERLSRNIGNGEEIILKAKDKGTIAKVQKLVADQQADTSAMPGCPCRVEGSETKIENTADGVRMLITGKTLETIKKIQEAAAEKREGKTCSCGKNKGKQEAKAKAAKKYICPMNCPGSESDKPGKCPKCGMPLVEKKN